MNYTESHIIGDTEYIFKTRLDWFSLDKIPQQEQFVVLVDADEDIEDGARAALRDEKRVLVLKNKAEYTLALLSTFLHSLEVDGEQRNITRKRIMAINPRHIPQLVTIAEDYLAAQQHEIAEFEPGNPTA